jgi:hypothetical protein
VWFTPELAVTYRPRRTFKALRRQFFTTGQWRRQIVDAHPETASFRYLAAPIVTALIGLGAVLGLIGVVGLALGIPFSWLPAAGQAEIRSLSRGFLTFSGNTSLVLRLLGFPNASFTVGPRATARAVPTVIRTVEVPVGRFDAPSQREALVRNLTRAVTPQWTPDFANVPVLAGTHAAGSAFSAAFPAGHPTVAQLVALINLSLPSGMTLSHNPDSGRYTVARSDGQAFSLDFASQEVRREAARVLGFRPGFEYEGKASYTGESRGSSAHITLDSTQPRYPIRFTETIGETQTLAADVASNPHGQDQYFLHSIGSGGVFNVRQESGSSTTIPAGLIVGDVLRVNAVLTTGVALVTAVVTAVQNHGRTVVLAFENDVASRLTVGQMSATCVSRNVALLHGENPLASPAMVGTTDPTLSGLSTETFGPCAEVLGLRARSQLSLPARLPFAAHLGPPDYFLMEVVMPCVADNLHSHVGVSDPSRSKRSIIAKFIVTNGFARISEDRHALRLTGPQDLEEIRVRFLNPDLSLVDWHGHEHSWTLLLDAISSIPTFLSI